MGLFGGKSRVHDSFFASPRLPPVSRSCSSPRPSPLASSSCFPPSLGARGWKLLRPFKSTRAEQGKQEWDLPEGPCARVRVVAKPGCMEFQSQMKRDCTVE